MRLQLILLSAALAGCTAPAGLNLSSPPLSATQAPTRGASIGAGRGQIAPLVNAHLHLMSPHATATQQREPRLPAIELPSEYAEVLRRREKVSGTPPTDDLFTDDAIIQEIEQGVWWRGHERINRFLGFLWKEVAYVPKAYEMGDKAGYIAGNLRTRGSKFEHWNFMIGLKKNEAGKWQIEAETFTKIPPPPFSKPVTAEVAIEQMDEAKVNRGVVLSVGYWYANAEGMRTENDWTVAEAARFPNRLVPFCGVNPLKAFAIAEVQRCAKIPSVKGIKIHLANAGINLEKVDHRAQLRDFVAAVNRSGLALVVHIRPIGNYTRVDADNFIKEILPAAPDIVVQIGHAANSTEGLTAFADAIEAGNPAVKNVIFDWGHEPPALMRRIGLNRFIFGTDMPTTTDPMAKQWEGIAKLEFTDAELRTIARNVPPYMK